MDFLVRLLPQESLVCMNTIPSQQTSLRFWNELFDIVEQVRGCLFWSCLRSNNLRGEPTLAMGFRTPLILSHAISPASTDLMRLVRLTISSILSFSWWITAPHPSSSKMSKFPLVIMQNISIITSYSTSKPVIFALSASAQRIDAAEWHIPHNQSRRADDWHSILPLYCVSLRKFGCGGMFFWGSLTDLFGSLALSAEQTEQTSADPPPLN